MNQQNTSQHEKEGPRTGGDQVGDEAAASKEMAAEEAKESTKPPEAGAGGHESGSADQPPEKVEASQDNGEANANDAPPPEAKLAEVDKEAEEELGRMNADLSNLPFNPIPAKVRSSRGRARKGAGRDHNLNSKSATAYKPWIKNSPRNWGELQGDIRQRFKKPSLVVEIPKSRLSESHKKILETGQGKYPNGKCSNKPLTGAENKLGRDRSKKGVDEVRSKSSLVKALKYRGRSAIKPPSGAGSSTKPKKTKGETAQRSKSKKDEVEAKQEMDKVVEQVSNMLDAQMQMKDSGVAPQVPAQSAQVQQEVPGEGGDTPVGKVSESEANGEGKEGEGELEATLAAQETKAPKKKGTVWRTFASPEEEEQFKAARKQAAKERKAKLKLKRKEQADHASKDSRQPEQPKKPKAPKKAKAEVKKSKGPNLDKDEKRKLKGKEKKDKDKSKSTKDSKSKPTSGAPSLGKRQAGPAMQPYAPEAKRIRKHTARAEESRAQMSAWLSGGDDAEMAESPQARSDLLSRHGGRTVPELVSYAREAEDMEGAHEVSWTDSTYQRSSALYLASSEGRLRMFRHNSSPTGRVESLDNLSNDDLREEMATPGNRAFHSSYLIELQRAIDMGQDYSCIQCGAPHAPTRTPTTVLLTENMQVATYLSPQNSTAPEEIHPMPKVSPNGHSDVLFVPCGLSSDPIGAFEAVYGSFKGAMNIIIDLGQDAIKNGESVEGVRKSLMQVARALTSLRSPTDRANTRVLFPSLILSKTGEDVALNPWDKTDYDMTVKLRLHLLNERINAMNVKLGHLESHKDQDSPVRWDNHLHSELYERAADGGGRMVEQANLAQRGAHWVGPDGRLHLVKKKVFSRVLDTVQYANSSAPGPRWRLTDFV